MDFRVVCPICDATFARKVYFKKHFQSMHTTTNSSTINQPAIKMTENNSKRKFDEAFESVVEEISDTTKNLSMRVKEGREKSYPNDLSPYYNSIAKLLDSGKITRSDIENFTKHLLLFSEIKSLKKRINQLEKMRKTLCEESNSDFPLLDSVVEPPAVPAPKTVSLETDTPDGDSVDYTSWFPKYKLH
jgi:hypothetical protein